MGWIIAGIIILLLVIRALYELKHLKVTRYSLRSDKLPAGISVQFVFLSDLHLRSYGDNNHTLIELVRKQQPEFILIGGDMTVKKENVDDTCLYELLDALAQIAPTYYASGNHETALRENVKFESDRFARLLDRCDACGITYLSNETVELEGLAGKQAETPESFGQDLSLPVEKASFVIAGLDLTYEYYAKKVRRDLYAFEIAELLGDVNPQAYTILLAHPPAFFEEYAAYGADLVLAGHYHGGAIRFGNVGLVSPQVRFFPKYSAGKFTKGNTTMIVTRGAGSHSVNLRLFNYPEIVTVTLTSVAPSADYHADRLH